jgi:hypothetical protein
MSALDLLITPLIRVNNHLAAPDEPLALADKEKYLAQIFEKLQNFPLNVRRVFKAGFT